jgi:flagellar biosynthesis protein FlhA
MILPAALIAAVMVILMPLPAMAIDVLLIANITLAVVVLLTSINVKTPMEFSVFPSLLLTATLGRLVLNVATTRRILTSGHEGIEAAGGVIQGFGQFVSSDNIVVGGVIFLIIIVIQFVVITKGSTRISEVAARFMLDSLPGRQMAIDADLNNGAIDQEQAQQRRAEVAHESDFYGSMDGASKFVRGDAIAALIITGINIAGGLAIGIWHGMSVPHAANTFTKLTIGDGLASQIPSFLIAVSAGLLITRSNRDTEFSLDFVGQLIARPQVLITAGLFVLALVFTKLPLIPLLTVGGSCLGLAFVLQRKASEQNELPEDVQEAEPQTTNTVRIEDYLAIDPLEIEVGIDLIPLADPTTGGDLLQRINRVRQSIAAELGIILPKVRIRDNLNLEPNQYRLRIYNNSVAESSIEIGQLYAICDTISVLEQLSGIDGFDPASGRLAKWIDPDDQELAQSLGCFVQPPAAVVANHLAALSRRHADWILTRDATKHLVNEVKKTSPAVVDELIPDQFRLADVQTVLQMLLREGVSIRQLGIILETLGNHADISRQYVKLVELVRQRLAANVCAKFSDENSRLHALIPSAELTETLEQKSFWGTNQIRIELSREQIDTIIEQFEIETERHSAAGIAPIVLSNPAIRPALRQILAERMPGLVVMSTDEVTSDVSVNQIGMIELLDADFNEAC